MENEGIARRRAELIIQVRSGRLTAKAAAQQLGVSRKTYYKWEQRALEGMVKALSERPNGRPALERDPEQERLREQVQALEEKLQTREQAMRIKEIMEDAGEKKE